MKKSKVMTTIILFAMLVSMVGIATASPESVVVSPANQALTIGQSPPGGAFSPYSIAVSQILPKVGGNVHTIKATTTLIVSGSGSTSDLMYNFHHGASSSGWISSGTTWTWTDGGGTIDALTVDVMDTGSALDTMYQFKVDDSYPVGRGSDTAEATVYGTAPIPEQKTVVLTSVGLLGVIGLVMSRRYKK